MITAQKTKIINHCEITSSKRVFAHEYLDSGVPFYRGKEISEKQRSPNEINDQIFISREKFNEIKSKYGAPIKGDLLLTSVGTIGNPYLVKEGEEFYFKDGNLTWFRNFKDLNSQWLYYWLLSPQGKKELNKCTIGASQKAYTINLLEGMEFDLLPFPTQNQIASVLSAYDDLIENNEKRIKALEEMAELLYTEWFVKFKFPGHEKIKLVDSGTSYGKIPEGWKIKKFAEIFDIKYGKNLPTSKINDTGKYKVYGAGGVIGYYDQKNIETKTSLVTCRGNGSGTVWRTSGEGFVTNNAFTINGKENFIVFEFIFNTLKNCNINSSISGSAQPQITIENINFVQLLIPPKDLVCEYVNQVKNNYVLSDELRNNNQNLSNIRDLLIPQLVTGKRELKNI